MEDVNIGKNGIDTEFERDIINYNPKLEYQVDAEYTVNDNPEEELSTTLEEVSNEQDSISEKYEDLIYGYEKANDVLNKFKEELKGTYIPLTSEDIQLLNDYNIDFGIEDFSKGIPFELYDNAISGEQDLKNQVIQEIVEAYSEDIEGDIALELYPDLKEVVMNMEELYYLLSQTVYKNLTETTPETIKDAGDVYLEELKKAEEKQKNEFESLTSTNKQNEDIYYKLLVTEFETDKYFKAYEEYKESKKEIDYFSRIMNQQKDIVNFADNDLEVSNLIVRKINRAYVNSEISGPEKIEKLISKQYEKNTPEYNIFCSQLQAVAKIQLNNQIKRKKESKDILKTTGSLKTKVKIHDEVINNINLRNNVYLNLFNGLNNLVEPTRETGVEDFLNQIAEGMEIVRKDYRNNLQEMYQAHVIDQEVRYEKINLVVEKQVSRESYLLLENLIK